jgi:hypothetical protein
MEFANWKSHGIICDWLVLSLPVEILRVVFLYWPENDPTDKFFLFLHRPLIAGNFQQHADVVEGESDSGDGFSISE